MVVACQTISLSFVALLLYLCKEVERNVYHILFWPYCHTVASRILIVNNAWSSKLQWHLIFIVVALVVATQAYEYCQLVVAKVGDIVLQCVSMHKHLHTTILTKVVSGILIYTLSLVARKVCQCHRQCLLVSLGKLRLSRVLLTTDAWRHHVVDRSLIIVLLNIHSCCGKGAATGSRVVESLLVYTPFATHKVETTKSQYDRMLETCEEHTHEADACEVVDGAHLVGIFLKRNAELIPCGCSLIAITQWSIIHSLVYDIVFAHYEVLRTNADMILIVFLVFVESVVLVDILNVRSSLI